MHFSYNSDDPLNGIINYLRVNETDKFNNFLSVEVQSSGSAVGKPRDTIERNEQYWVDNENDLSPITYLLPYPIRAEGYVIQTSNNPPGKCHPKTWILEAFLDGVKNKLSEEYSDGGQLNGNLKYAYFEIKSEIYQSFKIIPLTSYRSDCVKRFDFNEFEIFGTIILPHAFSCSHNTNVNILRLIYLFICI